LLRARGVVYRVLKPSALAFKWLRRYRDDVRPRMLRELRTEKKQLFLTTRHSSSMRLALSRLFAFLRWRATVDRLGKNTSAIRRCRMTLLLSAHCGR